MMKFIPAGILALVCAQTLALPMFPPRSLIGPIFNPLLPFRPMLNPFINPMMRPVPPFGALNRPYGLNPASSTRNQLGNRGPMITRGMKRINQRSGVMTGNRNPPSKRMNRMSVLRSPARSKKSSTIITRNTNRNSMVAGSRQFGGF